MDTFMKVYEECLREAITSHPEEYRYGPDAIPGVLEKMRPAIYNGSYNKDSRAFRATCKKLGIKHTYSAITHYITNHATLHLPPYNVPLALPTGRHQSGTRG